MEAALNRLFPPVSLCEQTATDKTPLEAAAALAAKAASGDVAAFEVLVRLYERRIYLLAARFAPSREDTEELSQEILLKLHRSLHRYDPDRPFEPWLFRLAINVCRKRSRKLSGRKEIAFEEHHDRASLAEPDMVNLEDRRQLDLALRRLPS